MNKINPKKLLNSKWTAVNPINKELHFLVSELKLDEDGVVVHCALEAIMSKRVELIDWKVLQQSENWRQGWK